MISNVGIIDPDHLELFHLVWKKFVALPLTEKEHEAVRDSLIYDPDANEKCIPFVGLFDPVFSGYPLFVNGDFRRVYRDSVVLPRSIRHCVVLLAIDDARRHFLPMLWEKRSGEDQVLKQIWLPGVHSDIGGTNYNSLFGDIALLTMMEEIAASTKLRFFPNPLPALRAYVRSRIKNKERVIIGKKPNLFWRIARLDRAVASTAHAQLHAAMKELYDQDFDILYKGKPGKYDDRYQHYCANAAEDMWYRLD
jgi:hypothetical protein